LAAAVVVLQGCSSAGGGLGDGKPFRVPAAELRTLPALDLDNVVVPDLVEHDGGFARLSFPQGARLSKETGRHLFLYFHTPWCGPCKELDAKVFPEAAFQEYALSLVSIRVDGSSEDGGPVAARYGVDSYPTMVVCEPGGKEIERFFGFHPTREFCGTIADYIRGVGTADWHKEKALASPDDLTLAFTAGRELAIRHRGLEAAPFLERVWREDPDNRTGQVPRAMLLLASTVYLDQLKDQDSAIPVLKELSERFPDTFHGTEATYMTARALLETQRSGEALDVLRTRVAFKKDDPMQFFRFGSFCLRYDLFVPIGVKRMEEGVALHPGTGYLWKTLADLRFRAGDYAGAVEALEKGVSLDPNSEAWSKLLETYRGALKRSMERR